MSYGGSLRSQIQCFILTLRRNAQEQPKLLNNNSHIYYYIPPVFASVRAGLIFLYFIDNFIDEIANSRFTTNVSTYPVFDKEPYEAYADQLENYVDNIHQISNRNMLIRPMVFELLNHGYFGIYSNGLQWWFLSAWDLFPGDPAVTEIQDQPFWVRQTHIIGMNLKKIKGIDLTHEIKSGELPTDYDNITLLDTWVKDKDLNVCFTQGGQQLYEQKFPYPKRYPFSVANDSLLMNSFYPKPLMNYLTPHLVKAQQGLTNIEESSKSIANPILTYDIDAGIDINALQAALKIGYKRIIVGKNKEGNLAFHAPGALPGYALDMPEFQMGEMMRHLGINQTFMGRASGSAREKGAITQLLKTSFRKLGTYAGLIENSFTNLDNYLIEYAQTHQLKLKDSGKMENPQAVFQKEVSYIAREKFGGFTSEDTTQAKNLALIKWKTKLQGQRESLREMGASQPTKIVKEFQDELKDNQALKINLQKMIEQPPESLMVKISDRLKGQLISRFYLAPIADDKVLIRCLEEDLKMVNFLLAHLSSSIMVQTYIHKKPIPVDQQTSVVVPKETEIQPKEEVSPEKQKEAGEELRETPTQVVTGKKTETRGRPAELKAKGNTPDQVLKEALERVAQQKEYTPKDSEEESEKNSTSPPFSEDRVRDLVKRRHTVRNSEKLFNLPGLYIAEPHAKWIFTGKKPVFLKARKYDEMVNKPYLLVSRDKVYGVIIVREITENFDFEKTRKFHLVTPSQAEKFWFKSAKEKGTTKPKLYIYLFEFHPFANPIPYDRPEGVQTFIKAGDIKFGKEGLPAIGDLTPISLKPFVIPPPFKPEKRALNPHEVFSPNRLDEILPDATYDVSEKVDGLLAFVWIKDGKVRMYSESGNKWPDERIAPLLKDLAKVFKHNVLLCGELIMEGIRRKDVTGYIHARVTPTPNQLKSLRYKLWDILYVKDQSIASKPFKTRSAVLDLYISKGCKGQICRVNHSVVKRSNVDIAVKKNSSLEGAFIRDVEAAYWATHTGFKMKYHFDVDAKVFAVEKTRVNVPIFHCMLKDGTYIGQTYGQLQVKAKPGDVIRVNVDHISIRPDGSIGWYAPKPKSWKEGKITAKSKSPIQKGIGGADSIDLLKEIYLVTGGTEDRWKEWSPKFETWKKEKMPALVESVKSKIKAGVPASKT